MQVTRRYCIDCVHATLLYPDNAFPFYQCGNLDFVTFNLVDGSKTRPSCEDARMTDCGAEASGFLPIVPDLGLPLPQYVRAAEMDNGVSLVSARHPRKPWYKRFLFWLRYPWANRLNEDSLETIEIEVRRD